MSKEILDSATQRRLVRDTVDLGSYDRFTRRVFLVNRRSVAAVRQEREGGNIPDVPDYYRLLGLVGNVTAQFGFRALDGQLTRHNIKDWTGSPVSPRHQLALAVYMARANVQSYPIKEAVIAALTDTTLEPGVWGTPLSLKGGQIVSRGDLRPEYAEGIARRRMERDVRPICLPDKPLNAALAALDFDGDAAERMSTRAFEDEVYPQLQPVVGELFDPESVFLRNPK
jgi:hypothetical protein